MNFRQVLQRKISGAAIILLLFPLIVSAQIVNIPEVVDVYLSDPTLTLTYKIGAVSAATEIVVNPNFFTITTGPTDTIHILQFQGKSMENDGTLLIECSGSTSKTSIGPNRRVTFTPLNGTICPPASGPSTAAASSTPSSSGGGVVSSGGGAPALSTPVQRSPAVSDAQKRQSKKKIVKKVVKKRVKKVVKKKIPALCKLNKNKKKTFCKKYYSKSIF